MKIITRKLALLRWVMALAVAVMVSGCILPPPWMRELDPWALTNMTPDERPAEEIDWIEFEVEVSEHVKRVEVRGVSYANAKRSCNRWDLGKGGSLAIGEGSTRHIWPKTDINISKNHAGFFAGSILMPRNKYLPGYCDWRPNSRILSTRFYLMGKNENPEKDEWGGGVFSPSLILYANCTDSYWYDRTHISHCLESKENEIVFTNVDNHCSKRLGAGGETRYNPLEARMANPIIVNGEYAYKKYINGRIRLLVTPTVEKIRFVYNCNQN